LNDSCDIVVYKAQETTVPAVAMAMPPHRTYHKLVRSVPHCRNTYTEQSNSLLPYVKMMNK